VIGVLDNDQQKKLRELLPEENEDQKNPQ